MFVECDEYKDILATENKVWGIILPQAVRCTLKTYDCGSVGIAGLIVGGLPAKIGEFPHMAGKFKNGSPFVYFIFLSYQQSDGESATIPSHLSVVDRLLARNLCWLQRTVLLMETKGENKLDAFFHYNFHFPGIENRHWFVSALEILPMRVLTQQLSKGTSADS